MFGRRKGRGKGPVANQLRQAAEPNKLSWVPDDTSDEQGEANFDETDELEPDEIDASFEDDDEADSEDEVEIARRQEELRAELERQAEEFGLARYDPRSTYGENGEAVVGVLDELERMDVATAEQLADAWMARDPSERDVVEREMRHRHRDGKRSYELTAAEDAVTVWLNGKLASEPDDADLWRIVAEAGRGAVDALILDRDLDDADYDTLYGAWQEVIDADEGDEGDEGGAESGESSTGEADAGEPGEFGPNTELVRQFLVKLGELTLDQTLKLAAMWKQQERGDLRQAHDGVRDLADEDQAWRDQIQAAQKEVSGWTQLLPAAADHFTRRDNRLLEARTAALPAAVDAVTALVLADLLEPEDAETLYRPWADAIGEPALPEFEDDGQG